MPQPSRLQQDLADRIVQLVNEDELPVGALLNENSLARRLAVSRTPVRGALQHLEDRGIVARRPNRGVELIAKPLAAPSPPSSDDHEEWLVRIARDQRNGRSARGDLGDRGHASLRPQPPHGPACPVPARGAGNGRAQVRLWLAVPHRVTGYRYPQRELSLPHPARAHGNNGAELPDRGRLDQRDAPTP